MGSSSSSTKQTTVSRNQVESIDVEPSLPGYVFPEPPLCSIDDVRVPIPWYREETDEFDWAQLERERSVVEERTVYTDRSLKEKPTSVKTPLSVIRPASVLTRPLSNRALRTPSGRQVSFLKLERTRDLVSRNESKTSTRRISMRGIKLQEKTPHPLISFDKIDEHAKKVPEIHTLTYHALLEYLKQPIRYERMPELLTARALIVWLANLKIKTRFIKKPDPTTPKGLINSLAQGALTLTEAYVILCRKAGLQCVLLEGLTKLDYYEVGEGETDWMDDVWTAVNVDGGWQIVHPKCILQDVFGGTFDCWIQREIVNEGSSRSTVVTALKSLVKNFVNEDYFMPLPEVFIHMFYAYDIRWQLLPMEFTVRSMQDFLSLPYVLPAFFKLGFKLVTEPQCTLSAKNGICKIWIANDRPCAHRLVLNYKLSLLETECTGVEYVLNDLQRLVIHSRHESYFYIEVRFPFEGSFKLEINGGFYGAHMMRLCHFKLVCSERLKTLKYIPYEPEHLMWGPSPAAEENGLTIPSIPSGIVYFRPRRKFPVSAEIESLFPKKVFSFHVDPDAAKCTDFACTLVGFTEEDFESDATPLDENGCLKPELNKQKKKKKLKQLDEHVPNRKFNDGNLELKTTHSNMRLTVTSTVPNEGEFALIIFIRKFKVLKNGNKQHDEPAPVCAYLLRTINDTESVSQRLARSQLVIVMRDLNVTAIRNAAEKCLREKISHTDDELVTANTLWEYLTFKKDLNDAIHRRNIHVVNSSLRKISTYRYKSALRFKIRRLFKLRQELKRLIEFKDDIPALVDAGMEVVQMVDPPPEVHLTMAALFLLLEEPEKSVESWDYIVERMSSDTIPEEAPIYKKMHHIAEMYPSKNTQRKILSLLSEFGLDTVRGTSTGAARFHRWVGKVMAVLQDDEFKFEDDMEDVDDQHQQTNNKPNKPVNGTIPEVGVT